jgi:multiple sugar transport system substrate-binding protein
MEGVITKVKRWINYLMVGLILVGMLGASCQSNSNGETVTVKFSYPPFGYDSNLENIYWAKYVAQFEKENPGIKVEMTVENWDTVYTKWDQMLQSGNTADIGYDSPGSVMDWAYRGKLLPVTDVVNKLGGDAVFSSSMQYMKKGNEWYSVPNCDANQVLIYRKDMLKEAGFDNPPATWDELLTVAKACTKNGVYGLGMYMIDMFYNAHGLVGLMKSAGGQMLDSNGKLVVDSLENLKAFQFMVNLVDSGVIPPNAVSWKYGDIISAIGTGKIAMAIEWGGFGTVLESTFPDQVKNVGYAVIPKGPSGHSGSMSGMGGFFIFKDAKHPNEAKKFIEYMSRPEIGKEWATISGNVSPFLSIANDPDLTKLGWYKAIADQSSTAVLFGWDYGAIPGAGACQAILQKAFTDITANNIKPEDALKILQKEEQAALDAAAKQG